MNTEINKHLEFERIVDDAGDMGFKSGFRMGIIVGGFGVIVLIVVALHLAGII